MKKRSFKVTFGLQEGYSPNGKLHSIDFAANVIKKWMEQRLEQQLPVVSGLLQQGSLIFPAVGTDQKNAVTVSLSAIYTGELSSPDDMKRKETEVKETLETLAVCLKESLKQESVYIIYLDKNWCV
jgi:ferredoxin-fold anticodon binding domain-containing protein